MSQFAVPFICAGQEAAGRLNPVSCHASLILSNLGLQGRGLHLVLPFPPLPSQIYFLSQTRICKSFSSKWCTGNCFQILYGKLGVVLKYVFRERTKVSIMRMDFRKILAHSIPPCLRTHSCVNAGFSLVSTPGFEYQCNIQLTLCLGNFLVKYSIFISFLSRLFFSIWSFM